MKNLKVTTILILAFVALTVMSSKDNKKETSGNMPNMDMSHHDDANSNMNHAGMTASNDVMNTQQTSPAKAVLANYMAIKNALVADDDKSAATAGKQLESSL
ncbi:MAG TPA: DUF3347 domain-containing protein, partial [Flavobacteriaceae bacterium]|nr:DUF3347 domain-containing protein [Flavobacteriaceae bacterium]